MDSKYWGLILLSIFLIWVWGSEFSEGGEWKITGVFKGMIWLPLLILWWLILVVYMFIPGFIIIFISYYLGLDLFSFDDSFSGLIGNKIVGIGILFLSAGIMFKWGKYEYLVDKLNRMMDRFD